jgi:dolichol-phosphate hexosyltransferase
MLNKQDFTIILPVLNEELAIGVVIQELLDYGYDNILVVDGNSTDATLEIVSSFNLPLLSQEGAGKTGALTTAISNIQTPYFLVMDGDNTYDPNDIAKFLRIVEGHDQVFGVRERNIHISNLHKFGNWIINKTISVLYGKDITDACTGMYLLKTESAKKLEFITSGFEVEVEMAIQNLINGKIAEVPINYRNRIGESKLDTWKIGSTIMLKIIKMSFYYKSRMPLIILLLFIAGFLLSVGSGYISL